MLLSSSLACVLPSSNKYLSKATSNYVSCSIEDTSKVNLHKRRPLLLGIGIGGLILPTNPLLAQEEGIPEKFNSFVDKLDGYSYYYPSDWREFDFRGHDSAFKDRFLQLQNVRVSFIPTQKTDIHDLGTIDEVAYHLVKHVYSTPDERPSIYTLVERSEEGKNYYTIEYELATRGYATVSFATVSISNGRYYTLIVSANERRWRRYRNQLKVVADSFKMLDI
ncbi:hypothetical protein ACFE04_002835 [Oxalis oulophora]